MNISEMSDGAKADLLCVDAQEHDPIRLSALDGAAELVAAGLLEPGGTFAVLTLDGCDAVHALRGAP